MGAFIIWVLSCPDISVVSCEFFFGLKFLKFVLEISTELSRFNYRSAGIRKLSFADWSIAA